MRPGDSVRLNRPHSGSQRSHAVAHVSGGYVQAACGRRYECTDVLRNYGKVKPCARCAEQIEKQTMEGVA